MSYYFIYVHENAFGEFVCDKLGHKHFKIPVSVVNTGNLIVEPGIYLAKTSVIDKFIENGVVPVIPITLVKLLLKENDFHKEILEDHTNNSIDEGIDYDYTDDEEWDQWDHQFIFDCSDVVDVIQGTGNHILEHLDARFKIRYPEYANNGGESVENALANGSIFFKEIRKDILSPVLPDPSRSTLVPLFGNMYSIKKILSLVDHESKEPQLSQRVIRISSPEDIERWKECFADFFTVVWKDDHPEYVVYRNKGTISKVEPHGNGKYLKTIDFPYVTRQGKNDIVSVVIEE